MEERLFDTVEAAAFLGLSRERVRDLALSGQLPSRQYGRARMIRESDLVAFKSLDRKPGRPPKPKVEATTEGAAGQVSNGTAQAEVKPHKQAVKKKRTE